MGVEPSALLRTARLARIRLTEAETARLTEQLGAILEHVEELLAIPVDPAAAAPLAAAPAAAARADEPSADSLEWSVGEAAPQWRDGYYTVPRVLGP